MSVFLENRKGKHLDSYRCKFSKVMVSLEEIASYLKTGKGLGLHHFTCNRARERDCFTPSFKQFTDLQAIPAAVGRSQ
jgi:hypothetical protein